MVKTRAKSDSKRPSEDKKVTNCEELATGDASGDEEVATGWMTCFNEVSQLASIVLEVAEVVPYKFHCPESEPK